MNVLKKLQDWKKSIGVSLEILRKWQKRGWWGLQSRRKIPNMISRRHLDLTHIKMVYPDQMNDPAAVALIKEGEALLKKVEKLAKGLVSLPDKNPGHQHNGGKHKKAEEKPLVVETLSSIKFDKVRAALVAHKRVELLSTVPREESGFTDKDFKVSYE